jgi:hypothetical protein
MAAPEIGERLVSIAAVSVLFWVSLTLVLVAGTSSIALVVYRALEFYRAFRTSVRVLSAGAQRILDAASVAEQRTTDAASTERLQRSVARLQDSLAEARLLLREFRRFRGTLRSVTGLVPRK